MIIEFTGLPGSGKSTLTAMAQRDLARRGLQVVSTTSLLESDIPYHDTLGRVFRILPEQLRARGIRYVHRRLFSKRSVQEFMARHETAWAAYLRRLEFVAHSQPDDYPMVRDWSQSVIGFYMLLKRAVPDDGLYLWEEGIAHRAVNLFVDTSDSVDIEWLRGFLTLWPFPDVLIKVDADLDVCLQRTMHGRTPRLLGKGEHQVRNFFNGCAAVVNEIVLEAERRETKIIRFENMHQSFEESADFQGAWDKLLDNVESLVASQ